MRIRRVIFPAAATSTESLLLQGFVGVLFGKTYRKGMERVLTIPTHRLLSHSDKRRIGESLKRVFSVEKVLVSTVAYCQQAIGQLCSVPGKQYDERK